MTLTQRERIVRATARLVAAHGFAALNIPAISAAAGVSNQTFYEYFEGKQDAFLAAFEEVADDALAVGARAFGAAQGEPDAVGAGLRALLEYVAAHADFARLAFFELPTAGPAALDRADSSLEKFTAFLEPGVIPAAIGGSISATIREATASGVWAVIQHEIVEGRREELPRLAPEITAIALVAFNAP
jgi:AcrR family transcriptional regulator